MKTPFFVICTTTGGCAFRKGIKPAEVIATFGPPSNSWDDGVEHCLEYIASDFELRVYWSVWQFVWFKHLRFKSVDLEFATQPVFRSAKDLKS